MGARGSASGCVVVIVAILGITGFSALTAFAASEFGPERGFIGVASVLLVTASVAIVASGRASARRKALVIRRAGELQAHIERVRQERWAYLVARFGDSLARAIWDGVLIQGMPEECLTEFLGVPEAADQKVMKERRSSTLKYRPLGGNRFGLRVHIENGRVVGWEEKV
jgi:hypothetical protein